MSECNRDTCWGDPSTPLLTALRTAGLSDRRFRKLVSSLGEAISDTGPKTCAQESALNRGLRHGSAVRVSAEGTYLSFDLGELVSRSTNPLVQR